MSTLHLKSDTPAEPTSPANPAEWSLPSGPHDPDYDMDLMQSSLFRGETKSDQQDTTETFTPQSDLELLIDCADYLLHDYDKATGKALRKPNATLYHAIQILYQVCMAFDSDAPARDAFLKQKKVRQHGHCKNPYQPVIKAFFKDKAEITRSKTTKIAGAIHYGIAEKLDDSEFFCLLDDCGLEETYRVYQEKTKPTTDEKLSKAEKAQDAITAYLGDMPSHEYETNRHTIGRKGRVVLVADVQEDGSFKVLRCIDMLPSEVNRFLAAKAAKIGGAA